MKTVPVLILTVLALWQGIIWLGDMPRFLLPSPAAVAEALWLNRAEIARHAGYTLTEVVLGFGLGAALGAALAVAMGFSARLTGVLRRSPYEVTDDPGLSMKRPDWEELSQLDGDVLLYIVGGTNDSDKDGRHEEVLANPLWQMLPAVKSGNVHRISAATWMEFSGLASANRVLDDIERFVIAAP